MHVIWVALYFVLDDKEQRIAKMLTRLFLLFIAHNSKVKLIKNVSIRKNLDNQYTLKQISMLGKNFCRQHFESLFSGKKKWERYPHLAVAEFAQREEYVNEAFWHTVDSRYLDLAYLE